MEEMMIKSMNFLRLLFGSTPKAPKREERDDQNDMEAGEHAKEVALFSVVGMTCSACAVSIERAIKGLPGIHEVAVDVLNNRAKVTFSAVVSVSSCDEKKLLYSHISGNHAFLLYSLHCFCITM